MEFLWQDVTHAPFWIAVLQIIGINVVLSGDNAVVIALACMTLPPRQRLWGMILGAAVAVLMRVVFTLLIVQAMNYSYLRLAGGVLLFWVALKLVADDGEGANGRVKAAPTLWRAVRIVAIADIVMSLDNVIAIAAASEAAAEMVDLAHAEAVKASLIVFGLATSVPLIVAGSAILMALLERYGILIWNPGRAGWRPAGSRLRVHPGAPPSPPHRRRHAGRHRPRDLGRRRYRDCAIRPRNGDADALGRTRRRVRAAGGWLFRLAQRSRPRPRGSMIDAR
ncbi:MAG: YjbE family putative metal transport protein [Pseudolabrys sp.]